MYQLSRDVQAPASTSGLLIEISTKDLTPADLQAVGEALNNQADRFIQVKTTAGELLTCMVSAFGSVVTLVVV